MSIEAMKRALAKFESLWEIGIDAVYRVELLPDIQALRQAIEQAEKQEPVAWMYKGNFHDFDPSEWASPEFVVTPLFTAPQQREWVGLTDDDWGQLWQDFEDACDEWEFAYQEEAQKKHGEGHYYISSEDQWEGDKRTIRDLVEAKLKEKNGGS
jgi:hypothetical protein